MYSASIWSKSLSLSLSLKLEVQRTCPLTSKVGSLHASNIFRPFHIVRQQYSKMDNSGLKGPQIETIFSDFIGRFCFKNPGTKKCPKRAIVFQFFWSFFLFLFVLKLLPGAANYGNWMKLMASQATHNHPKRNLSIKSRTQVQLVLASLSTAPLWNRRSGTPILRVHMFQ